MRPVIAALHQRVQAQLVALDATRVSVARRYSARLAIEPYLGHRLGRGLLGSSQCRAVYFDRDSRPDGLFAGLVGALRRISGERPPATRTTPTASHEQWLLGGSDGR